MWVISSNGLPTLRTTLNGKRNLLVRIAKLCSDFGWNRLLTITATILAGALLIPIGKKGGGVRPIAVTELI